MSKSLEIRGTWKQVIVGKIAAVIVRVLGFTLRYQVDDPHHHRSKIKAGEPNVWAFWHGGLIVAPLALTHLMTRIPASTLTSASKDGAIIESFLKFFGLRSVRGSSSRRAVASLIALKRALKEGDQVFITPDGPRGPRYKMEAGVVKLAQSAGVPLYAVRFDYSSCWVINSWDRLRIPKPFSKITIHVKNPYLIPSKLEANDFESLRQEVEDELRVGIDDFPE